MIDRALARLERRYGRYALGNLTYFLVAAQGFGFIIALVRPDLVERMALDVERVRAGEAWRLLTWLAYPLSTSPIWVLFALYWLFTVGTSLEQHWGAFRYQVYWLLGVALSVTVALVGGVPVTPQALIMSLFLAFATVWPDYEIRVFMILPVKVKWLALLDAAFLLYVIATAHGWERLIPLVAIGNYLLFFGGTLAALVRTMVRQGARAGARSRFAAARADRVSAVRTCAVCGVTDEDRSIEFRVCDCERCGGKLRNLCITHARDH